MNFSAIEYYGKQNREKCGYCGGQRSSFSHGMHAYIMSVQDYQDLIDRGWRRCGHYCYKPNMSVTCCPSYTIKCDTQEFKLSKSQKKILRKVNKFLRDGIKSKDNVMEDQSSQTAEEKSENLEEIPSYPKKEIGQSDFEEINKKLNCSDINLSKRFKSNQSNEIIDQCDTSKGLQTKEIAFEKKNLKKAKQIRLERKIAKMGEGFKEVMNSKQQLQNKEKLLADFINESNNETNCHKLTIKIVSSDKGDTAEAFELYKKYQVTIHNDAPQKITKHSFDNFLCKTPLKHYTVENGPAEGYGSFHQQYWLDDKLIAIGVVDILPYCLSSVYFIYDPDYSFLSLGTYGTLREIDFVKNLTQKVPSIKYYYMGFYIHSCPKMRYKGKLSGSYLLCPEKYSWHLLTDEIRSELEKEKYQVLNKILEFEIRDIFTSNDLDDVLILMRRNATVSYAEFKKIRKINLDEKILEYGQLVGKTCAHRILFSI